MDKYLDDLRGKFSKALSFVVISNILVSLGLLPGHSLLSNYSVNPEPFLTNLVISCRYTFEHPD